MSLRSSRRAARVWLRRGAERGLRRTSESVFMATANELEGIPSALRDRLRCVEVPGYSPAEQIQIRGSRSPASGCARPGSWSRSAP